MKTIFKYKLQLEKEQTIELPKDAEILDVQDQAGSICFWALVDTEEKQTEFKTFYIFGTGHEVPERQAMTYLGSIQQLHGIVMVWHIFMRHIP